MAFGAMVRGRKIYMNAMRRRQKTRRGPMGQKNVNRIALSFSGPGCTRK
jgi:hypothetical protein